MTITFKQIEGRRWLGNGFGYEPARYGVYRDGSPVGTIQNSLGEWYVYALDPSEEYGKRPLGSWHRLARAKEVARELLK